MRQWKKLKCALCFVAMLGQSPALLAFECNVKVNHVLMYWNGMVSLNHNGRGDYTHICSLNETYQTVSPATCAMWTASLQSIKAKAGTINIMYPGEGSCATLPTYGNAPVPVYIGNMNLP